MVIRIVFYTFPHELRLQDVSATTVVLEQTLVHLHLEARRLVVECD